MQENVDIEYKSVYVKTVKNEVVAFANTEGGTIYIGIDDDGIREMIMQSMRKSFEKCRSMLQNLTFETLEYEMKIRGLDAGEPQMRTLQMVGEDGLYTNLALLLSDQCVHTIKVAVFQGKDKEIFRERREFTGSLLK